MGDDTALPPLAGRARPLFSYFRQRFAQVTNPAIDHIRERFVMSLSTLLGARGPLLVEAPENAAGIELESFFLYPSALDEFAVVRIDATFDPARGARECVREAREGRRDCRARRARDAARHRQGRVARAAAGAEPARDVGVHHHLVKAGLRTLATLLVESDEPREVHHVACLIGFGAEAVCPRLALQTIAALAEGDRIGGDRPSPAEAQARFKQSIEDGVLKVMSKLGISDIASYCGAQTFEALGLDGDLVEAAFPGTPWSIGGIGLDQLEGETVARAAAATGTRPRLENPGYFKFRKGGEPHETNPDVLEALQAAARSDDMGAAHALRSAVRTNGWERYSDFAELVNGREPMEVRDLLELRTSAQPVPLEEVEPAESIVQRFSSGGNVARVTLRRGARDDRARVQQSRSPFELRRGRGGPGALPDRPELADQADRLWPLRRHGRSTRRSPTSSRSRSLRAPSPARAASCPATRSLPRSRGCATHSPALRSSPRRRTTTSTRSRTSRS